MRSIIITNIYGDVVRRFDTIVEAAKFYGINKGAMAYRAKTKFYRNGETTSFEDTEIYENIFTKPMKRNKENYPNGYPFDEKKHVKVKYEVSKNKLCVTPCPYLEAPKPFVGSGRCQICTHFKYKDKENGCVICSGHKF